MASALQSITFLISQTASLLHHGRAMFNAACGLEYNPDNPSLHTDDDNGDRHNATTDEPPACLSCQSHR